MDYPCKLKYSISEAAVIISKKTDIQHSQKDIYQAAETDKIRIAIYKPNFNYIQEKAASNNQAIIHSASEHSAYPLLSLQNITKITDNPYQEITEKLVNIDAINHEGVLFKITNYSDEEYVAVNKNDLVIIDFELLRYINCLTPAPAQSAQSAQSATKASSPQKTKVKLLIEVILLMGLDPLDLTVGDGEIEKILNKCKEKFPKKFFGDVKALCDGQNSTWRKAKKQGLIIITNDKINSKLK